MIEKSSSEVFSNLRITSEILGKCSETFVWPSDFRQSSESGRKSSENNQKRPFLVCSQIKQNATRLLVDMEILSFLVFKFQLIARLLPAFTQS